MSPRKRDSSSQTMQESLEDATRVAKLLAQWIERSGRSVRQVERDLSVGQSTINRVLIGRSPLQLSLLLAVLRVIGATPGEFFAAAYPEAVGAAPGERRELTEKELDLIDQRVMEALGRVRLQPADRKAEK
jgi:transcriptional regulator with XRE-family HTH domain